MDEDKARGGVAPQVPSLWSFQMRDLERDSKAVTL